MKTALIGIAMAAILSGPLAAAESGAMSGHMSGSMHQASGCPKQSTSNHMHNQAAQGGSMQSSSMSGGSMQANATTSNAMHMDGMKSDCGAQNTHHGSMKGGNSMSSQSSGH